ncbi:MAG TPA: lectin like domain-containing protein [Synergistaceae bacterium]|nr:lectin like domain-containing protein [Synergistaceae bacterium]HQH78239.1 lectin like domain-containing protein [Synergistaceae bacterium]
MVGKRLMAVAVTMMAVWGMGEGASAQGAGHRGPLSPAFIQWQSQREHDASSLGVAHRPGRIPSPVDLSHVRGRLRRMVAEIPASFDLRSRGGVSPVRDQSDWGACWTFGALGSLESFLLTSGSAPGADHPWGEGSWDLSERHLAWFGYMDQDADHVAFTGDTATPDDVYNNGGDDWRAVAILARGTGAVDEDDAPYMGSGWDTPDPSGEEPRRVLLTEALYLPYQDGAFEYPLLHRAIKTSVMTYGASSIGMFAEFGASYYNPATFAYHYAGPLNSNHAVCIVGWDDAYPKENFPAGHRPAEDGAWIVRNSWGSSFGDGGYFYASYASTLDSGVNYIGVPEVSAAAQVAGGQERIHDYDPLGWCNTYGFDSETGWFANVFPLSEDAMLKAVSFYVAAESASYQVRVYSDVSPDASGGFRGTLVTGPLVGSLDIPGYRRVAMSGDVVLPGGKNFAVEVRLTTPGYLFPVPLELPLEGYSDKATAQPRQSWVSANGAAWEDLTTDVPNANVCLKAFTVPYVAPTPTPAPTSSPSSASGGGCSTGLVPGALLLLVPLAFFLRR